MSLEVNDCEPALMRWWCSIWY